MVKSKKPCEEEGVAAQMLDTGKNTHPYVKQAQAAYLDELPHSSSKIFNFPPTQPGHTGR